MRLDTPHNRRGRQIGAKNKATLSTFAPTGTLMEWQESRLQAYIDAMREVRVGPGHTRGSVNDFIRLAARSHVTRAYVVIWSIQYEMMRLCKSLLGPRKRFITLVCPQKSKSLLELIFSGNTRRTLWIRPRNYKTTP